MPTPSILLLRTKIWVILDFSFSHPISCPSTNPVSYTFNVHQNQISCDLQGYLCDPNDHHLLPRYYNWITSFTPLLLHPSYTIATETLEKPKSNYLTALPLQKPSTSFKTKCTKSLPPSTMPKTFSPPSCLWPHCPSYPLLLSVPATQISCLFLKESGVFSPRGLCTCILFAWDAFLDTHVDQSSTCFRFCSNATLSENFPGPFLCFTFLLSAHHYLNYYVFYLVILFIVSFLH